MSNVSPITPSLAQVTHPAKGPTVVDALRQVAMLVRVICTAPGTLKTDKRASEEADTAKKAKRGTGSMKVRVMNGIDEDRQVRKLQREAVEALDHCTTPWGQDAQRLLPNESFMDFIRKFTAVKDKIDTLVNEIETNVNSICAKANANKGDYDVDDLQPEDLIGAYSISIEFQEIPSAGFTGVKGKIDKIMHEYLNEQYAMKAEVRFQDGLKAGFSRLLKPLSDMVERLEAYDKAQAAGKGEKSRGEGAFRDTLTENVKEAVESLASFNLLNDPDLKEFTNSLILFQNVNAKDLRSDSQLREGVKTKAQEAIERLRGMMV